MAENRTTSMGIRGLDDATGGASETSVCILLIGTADTKPDELQFIREQITALGHRCILMDVGVKGECPIEVDISRHEVMAKAGSSLHEILQLNHENSAMQVMASGASALASELAEQGRIDGVLIIGGTMGTDLGLDVTAALPFGMAKVLLSTVAFSPIIPADRIASDLMMILWTGGLWGRNEVSESVMRQAAGAVIGAAVASKKRVAGQRPIVGVSSLGTSGLSYIPRLWTELTDRGYDVVLFHSVGPGGRSLENMAAQGRLAAVLDLCLIELSNQHLGSVVHSGSSRLEAAGKHGVPQIIAPGAIDAVDFCTWAPMSTDRAARFHAHNRLIGSSATTPSEKVSIAAAIAEKVNQATAPTCLIIPTGGVSEWSRPGQPLHDDEGMAAFVAAIRSHVAPHVEYREVDAHINDSQFIDAVIDRFDTWVDEGKIARSETSVMERTR
ncbi:MAG: hypothetical protein JWP66_908 [Naasia sp.]|nr:hypothetical protein [Naasia sp.]